MLGQAHAHGANLERVSAWLLDNLWEVRWTLARSWGGRRAKLGGVDGGSRGRGDNAAPSQTALPTHAADQALRAILLRLAPPLGLHGDGLPDTDARAEAVQGLHPEALRGAEGHRPVAALLRRSLFRPGHGDAAQACADRVDELEQP